MILSTPVFKLLDDLYPDSQIVCLASSLSSQLIEGNPHVDETLVYDPPWFDWCKDRKIFRDYLAILSLIRHSKFDMAIDLRGNIFNYFFLMFLAGIRQRVSFDAALGSFLLTLAVPYEKGKHESDYFIDIIRALGGKLVPDPQPFLSISTQEEEFAENFFHSKNIGPEDKVIALHPGAGPNRIYKRWPEERFCQLGKILVKRFNIKILVTGSKVEINLASRIKNSIGGNAILAAGEVCNLKHLAAVLKRCSLCIGTSTGTIHVAAATGIPVAVLCGPENSDRWRPLGNNNLLIEKDISCRPCREETCHNDGQCLKLISPEYVLEKIEPLLADMEITPCNDYLGEE
jgi:lipopolysaccharide heptosyltransferase II